MQWVGTIGALWGGAGVFGILGLAVYRLVPRAVAAYETGLSGWQWIIALGFCGFMAYAEGYRGFQLRFSPRTAARIRYLRDHPSDRCWHRCSSWACFTPRARQRSPPGY
jgi:hypothetical protein